MKTFPHDIYIDYGIFFIGSTIVEAMGPSVSFRCGLCSQHEGQSRDRKNVWRVKEWWNRGKVRLPKQNGT